MTADAGRNSHRVLPGYSEEVGGSLVGRVGMAVLSHFAVLYRAPGRLREPEPRPDRSCMALIALRGNAAHSPFTLLHHQPHA